MATYTIMIIATMVFAQAFSATEVTQNKDTTAIRTPASLSYEDLVYILENRLGYPQKPRTLSPCARAILGCCKQNQINEECSESLKCGAYFFDDNPCDLKFLTDALKAAEVFYKQFEESKPRKVFQD